MKEVKLDSTNELADSKLKSKHSGIVYLIGFGPGDPDLLTIKAYRILCDADVIYYDDLINKEYISRFKAEKYYIGKRKGHHSKDQDEINRLLLKSAAEGKTVVRLKGGDPMIFGHGGEEIAFLERYGINTEVIPGISSGIAAAGLTKIPLTYRGISSSVTLLSGHSIKNMVVPKSGTLVFYMSVSTIKSIGLKLINEGWDCSTPAAVIYSVSNQDQEEVFTTLNQLIYSEREFKTPSIIIIGEVVKMATRKENRELLLAVNRLCG